MEFDRRQSFVYYRSFSEKGAPKNKPQQRNGRPTAGHNSPNAGANRSAAPRPCASWRNATECSSSISWTTACCSGCTECRRRRAFGENARRPQRDPGTAPGTLSAGNYRCPESATIASPPIRWFGSGMCPSCCTDCRCPGRMEWSKPRPERSVCGRTNA